MCRNYEVKGGGDRVLLCVMFALMFPVLISSLFAHDYPDSPLSVSVRVHNIVFDAICRYLTLFVNEVCLRLCCYAIMLHLKRIQCLRVAEKSKSAKDCERDLINKAQVSTLWLSRFVFSVFNIQPNHFIFCCASGALFFARRRRFSPLWCSPQPLLLFCPRTCIGFRRSCRCSLFRRRL